MSKVAVINSGSSSIKFKVYEMPSEKVMSHILIENIGKERSQTVILRDEEVVKPQTPSLKNHKEAILHLEKVLREYEMIKGFTELHSVGHRVVHGGERFISTVLVDDKVIEEIETISKLAPLHNTANLEAIKILKSIVPSLKHIAVFDTSFHQSMPQEAYRYALPKDWYEKYGVRRYGFHGSSYHYITEEASKLLHKNRSEINLIALHLGNGSSVCAVERGKSVDTSMGLTPLDGLIMGSRSGTIDPSIIFYIQRECGIEYEKIETLLNRESGLKALCGENDMRTILKMVDDGDRDAELAFNMFVRGVVKFIGSYALLLGRVDGIVFTGGIGENSPRVREAIANSLKILQITVDRESNIENRTVISREDSKIALLVIPTDEEIVIARESFELIER
jgi:acetate kinase